MDEYLTSQGWYNSGACGCTPKKYTWKNESLPDAIIKVCPSRDMWYLYEYDHLILKGQSVSLESQYTNKYIQQ
jgi:hypothetical protein